MDLITGANGFIGSNIAKQFIRLDKKIAVLVRNKDLNPVLNNKNVKIIFGDLDDIESLKKATKGINTIYHVAGYVGGAQPKKELFESVNVKGTENLLVAAKENDVKNVVVLSSVTVYGETKNANEDSLLNPNTDYGKSKLEQEKVCEKYHKENGIRFAIIRASQVYGTGDTRTFLNIVKAIKKGKFLIIGNGNNRVNFLYVDDLAKAITRAGELLKQDKIDYRIYVVAGKPITMNEFADTIANVQNLKKPLKIPYFAGLVLALGFELISFIKRKKVPFNMNRLRTMTSDRSFDSSKAMRDLDFEQETTLEEGTKKYLKWLKESLDET